MPDNANRHRIGTFTSKPAPLTVSTFWSSSDVGRAATRTRIAPGYFDTPVGQIGDDPHRQFVGPRASHRGGGNAARHIRSRRRAGIEAFAADDGQCGEQFAAGHGDIGRLDPAADGSGWPARSNGVDTHASTRSPDRPRRRTTACCSRRTERATNAPRSSRSSLSGTNNSGTAHSRPVAGQEIPLRVGQPPGPQRAAVVGTSSVSAVADNGIRLTPSTVDGVVQGERRGPQLPYHDLHPHSGAIDDQRGVVVHDEPRHHDAVGHGGRTVPAALAEQQVDPGLFEQ